MGYRRFAIYNLAGGIIWICSFSYAGYFFGRLPFVQENPKILIFAIIFVSILPGVIEIWHEKRKHRKSCQ